MITEHYLNGTYYKYYHSEENRNLLFLLPGSTMSSRAFWDVKLPEGFSHSEYFYNSGIDVILFDPIGYGRSTEMYNYDRHGFAKQIVDVMKTIPKSYKNKVLSGFSASCAPALLAGHTEYFNKIIIFGPQVKEHKHFFKIYNLEYDKDRQIMTTDIEGLAKNRFELGADRLIHAAGKPSCKYEGWKQAVIDQIGTSWDCPYQYAVDIFFYWTKHRKHDLSFNNKRDILCFIGEYDHECNNPNNLDSGYNRFADMFPHQKTIVVPDSTHFHMLETNAAYHRKYVIDFCNN